MKINNKKLLSELKALDETYQFDIWEMMIENGIVSEDEKILDSDNLNIIFESLSATEIGCRWFYGGGCPAHSYFKINAYGNIESTDFLSDFLNFEYYLDEICEDLDFLKNLIEDYIYIEDIIEDIEVILKEEIDINKINKILEESSMDDDEKKSKIFEYVEEIIVENTPFCCTFDSYHERFDVYVEDTDELKFQIDFNDFMNLFYKEDEEDKLFSEKYDEFMKLYKEKTNFSLSYSEKLLEELLDFYNKEQIINYIENMEISDFKEEVIKNCYNIIDEFGNDAMNETIRNSISICIYIDVCGLEYENILKDVKMILENY